MASIAIIVGRCHHDANHGDRCQSSTGSGGHAGRPLLSILSQTLVRVGDTVVQVADLVVVHVLQVGSMEILGETLAVHEGKLLLDVVDARVDGRRGHGEEEQVEDLKGKSCTGRRARQSS